MQPWPLQLLDPASSTRTYVLADADSSQAIIIDPVAERLERDLGVLAQHGLSLRWILETHVHADHVTSASALAQRTGAEVAVPLECGVQVDARLLQDGDVVAFGSQSLAVIHTPGHTAGSSCYLWSTATALHLFTGDTLLIEGCGRTDFQSGDAGTLYDSIVGKLFVLPAATIVWPGHDYKGRTHSTIARERDANPRIAGKSREQFITTMAELSLAPPARLSEAVPANLRLGG
jgi:glyoxylase-like metal-dependent hydrolase (beta-lactamase superfamily II)